MERVGESETTQRDFSQEGLERGNSTRSVWRKNAKK